MLSKLKADLSAILERDPAAGGWVSAIVLYPSFHVMLAHRLAHPLWLVGLHTLSRFIMQTARWLTGIEIHPAAEIGEGFFADHGNGDCNRTDSSLRQKRNSLSRCHAWWCDACC